MQRAYISTLLELAEKNADILHLVADSGTGFDEMFQRYFPGRMLNFGIAEEHMVAAAAGLASAGKTPFVYTAGAFLAYRALEFIRDDICFQNMNVKIVGMGSGLAWSSLGPSHHTTEDIAVLRALPNLRILSPATPVQLAECVREAYHSRGPVYIRIGMNQEEEFFEGNYQLPQSGQDIMYDEGQVIIVTTGSILEEVMAASDILAAEDIRTKIINVVRIKPFEERELIRRTQDANFIVTVEEHSIFGGLGSIVAELIAEHGTGKKLLRIGLEDMFAKGYGQRQKDVRRENGLDAAGIAEKIREKYNE